VIKKCAVINALLIAVLMCFAPVSCSRKPDSINKLYYPSGKLMGEIPMWHGKKQGTMRWYYETGELKIEQETKNGHADGKLIFYYNNGIKEKEERLINDLRDGKFNYYDKNGRLIKTEIWKHDRLVKEINIS
jgi:antitoxin component YwqK of YwqJK toxin-antitoxin module